VKFADMTDTLSQHASASAPGGCSGVGVDPWSPYTLRSIVMDPPLILAPMSGVTNSAFRRFIKRVNPGCVGGLVSEFLSVEGMTRGSTRTLEMMRFREEERPFGIQIFGYDLTRMADAARMVQDAGVDFLDINCGCPAPKVVKRGGGCELMRQPEHLKELVRAVRKAVSIPLTLKMRSGWDESSKNAREIASIVVGEGVEAVTIHGRTRAQLYRDQADWGVVRSVAAEMPVPVLGSGDVVDRPSAVERLQGGVRALMIGRAALSNPFVFTEVMTGVKRNLRQEPLTMIDLVEQYIELLREDFPDRPGTRVALGGVHLVDDRGAAHGAPRGARRGGGSARAAQR
jgi:tRNA-dihydrouridine synthase B